MPKIVDHDARQLAITRAVARLIERDGIHAVSVRSVAAEADMQPSTLRHYFPSSDQMLAATIAMVRDDQAARLAALDATGSAQGDIRQAWLQALPLDATRRTEAHVWLAVTATARTTALRAVVHDINAGLGHLCEATARVFAPHSDIGQEALCLRAFTDGLAVNAVSDPDTFTAERVAGALDRYLAHLRG
ncbi:TetR/AcrR family transcriptional regulator [Microbacterium jiangjiandongii]|uniref:TetR/AcrR family transcriptional regulator n=1 Tax=Microbacterium jiangjiandongii TaxID=3049071 RepID=UPI00214BE95B|nr:TetR family transcriptional regulator C-terminal domain-containing protein [Microbacterium sp. zg.Y843]MCR2815528.1 TetR family transcriptional regulator C-terminal domain-containing protein [Microbacterium sp. zg.Y843]